LDSLGVDDYLVLSCYLYSHHQLLLEFLLARELALSILGYKMQIRYHPQGFATGAYYLFLLKDS